MKEIDWFITTLEHYFQVEVQREKVSFEGIELCHEEIYESLIPREHMNMLPDPLLFETMLYIDEEANEWIAGIGVEVSSRKWLYTVWLKNGETVSDKFLNQQG
ncbi:hypothetical protein [Bacillus sp. V5-8f]|uniref:hypothetical protein n=1 Tax=Bacillus sp. V5-8f TaxID=2053044 RepID=UPI000C764A8D|nr:hypothetical protein [Bacillus sp. V5-8f]PLT35772.1 hypothetical protein CUU64_00405 [Bacillus sp. V5-8f]